MKAQSALAMVLFGSAFWALGTLLYRALGVLLFETKRVGYWANLLATPVVSTLACIGVLRWQRVPSAQWAAAALLIAIPGMVGEAVLLSNFAKWMPKMQPASAGRYGGFLFATYALVLAVAEAVTLRPS